ncbi:hypothetical protein U2F10_33395 [Leptothoe sp. EHU-05/26/07-4]
MSESNPPSEPENNLSIEERKLALAEKELALKEQELRANINQKSRDLWFTSPVLLGIASAVFGLLGTGIGAALQGHASLRLERQKFEFLLIQKSLEPSGEESSSDDRKEAAKQLVFLVDSGIIQSLDAEKIKQLAEEPENLPTFSQGSTWFNFFENIENPSRVDRSPSHNRGGSAR